MDAAADGAMSEAGLPCVVATPRDALNELKWHQDALDRVVVWYRHRGAPDDRRAVPGTQILELGRSFLRIHGPHGGTSIPYHRVLVIERDGKPVWRRRQPDAEP